MKILLSCIFGIAAFCIAETPLGLNFYFNVKDFGAVGDGKTDCTEAFQKALNAASKAGGGTVWAGPGNYLFKGAITIPQAVTLQGSWQAPHSHNGIRDRGLPKPTDHGTTFLVVGGRGTEEGRPFITIETDGCLKGVCIYYPEQEPSTEPIPYPWTIAMRGKNPAVISVELLNPYNGIDASNNERHIIRDVVGQPLRRGIYVDAVYDIGRIENVHFNPWWSLSPKIRQWQMKYGEAFVFGRTDWQYVLNTFCYGYHVGYKFIQTQKGVCNGNFLGIGADDCEIAVLVEQSAPYGLLITNGEFVSFNGPDPVMVRVEETNKGSVRFVNCAFWGPANQIAIIKGGTVGFGDCTFVQWDAKNKGLAALQVYGGQIIVRGCEFQADRPQIFLGENVKKAIITDNLMKGAIRIENHSKAPVVINNNLGD